MYDPVTPALSGRETAPILLSVGIWLIKGLACQIFGLRAGPQSEGEINFLCGVL